jgi:hypothetical protein
MTWLMIWCRVRGREVAFSGMSTGRAPPKPDIALRISALPCSTPNTQSSTPSSAQVDMTVSMSPASTATMYLLEMFSISARSSA